MARTRSAWRNWVAAAVVLVPVAAVVVWSSFHAGAVECEVCVRFEGREACRTVNAASRDDGIRGAIDNACGMLTSGVTNTLRCARSEPTRAECRDL